MYLVHISNDNEIREAMVRDHFSELGEYVTKSLRAQKEGTQADLFSVSTHHFDELDYAMEFAKFAARSKPTWNIYVAKVENIVTTEVPKAVIKKVTAKGVVPQ